MSTERVDSDAARTATKVAFNASAMRSRLAGRRELIPEAAIDALAQRLELGAGRHGDNNWRKGGKEFQAACINHLQKHLSAYIERGDADDCNTAAIITNAAFLCHYERLYPWPGGAAHDDRELKPEQQGEEQNGN